MDNLQPRPGKTVIVCMFQSVERRFRPPHPDQGCRIKWRLSLADKELRARGSAIRPGQLERKRVDMDHWDHRIKVALRTLRDRTAVVNQFIDPLVDTDMPITEDRLAEVKRALNDYEEAKNAYHDSLRNADRTPPRQVA